MKTIFFLCFTFWIEMPSCQCYFLIILWIFGFIIGYYILIPQQQWPGQNGRKEGLIQIKEIGKDPIEINFSNYSKVKELMR